MAKSNSGTNNLPFGKILVGIINERGLTLRQAGELAGVGPSVIQNWIEGKNPHDLRAVARLAQALGISFKALLLGERELAANPNSLAEMFDEEEMLDGICRVSIRRLIPRSREE